MSRRESRRGSLANHQNDIFETCPLWYFICQYQLTTIVFISIKDHPQPDRERCSTKVRDGQVQVAYVIVNNKQRANYRGRCSSIHSLEQIPTQLKRTSRARVPTVYHLSPPKTHPTWFSEQLKQHPIFSLYSSTFITESMVR